MTVTARRLEGALRVYSRRVADVWMDELADAMRPEAPISTPTPTSRRPPGELRASIEGRDLKSTGSGWRFRLVAPVIQARTTDKGSPPHVIRARRAKLLRFWWERGPSGPGIYFYPKVNHPGNDPQDWWGPGLHRQAGPSLRRAARRVPF